MTSKTLGEKPKSFKFEKDGETFCLGSEIGNYLRLFRGTLYKKYPSLWRRPATLEERRQLLKLGITQHTIMVNVMLVRASEVEDIFNGDDIKYKTVLSTFSNHTTMNNTTNLSVKSGSFSTSKKTSAIQQALASANILAPPFNLVSFTASQYANASGVKEGALNNPTTNLMMAALGGSMTGASAVTGTGAGVGELTGSWNNSYHLDAVPSATPITRVRANKRIRNYDDILNNAVEQGIGENTGAVDQLVPLRLDMEIEGNKLRDCFIWNKKYTTTDPVGLRMLENFAEILCEDLQLVPISTYLPSIVVAMKQQIDCHFDNYYSHHLSNDVQEQLPVVVKSETATMTGTDENEASKEGDQEEAKTLTSASIDQRVIIKLNIHVGNVSLADQFEWDISNPDNSPEKFAEILCKELGLGGEFLTSIAYSIRGQVAWHHRTYAFSEAPLLTVDNAFRTPSEVDVWGPTLETLTDAEMEKKIRDQDRNTRRMRRLANIAPNW